MLRSRGIVRYALNADLSLADITVVPGQEIVFQVAPIVAMSPYQPSRAMTYNYHDSLSPLERMRLWGDDYNLCTRRRRGIKILEKINYARLQQDVQTLADRYISPDGREPVPREIVEYEPSSSRKDGW